MSNIIQCQGIFSNSNLKLSARNASLVLNTSSNAGINTTIDWGTDSLPTNSIGTKSFNIKSTSISGYPSLNLQVNNIDAFRLEAQSNGVYIKENRNLSLYINSKSGSFQINNAGAIQFGSSGFGSLNQVLTSQGSNAAPTWSTLDNSAIAANAGIVYSKLSLANSIVNADISSSAAIVDTKLATISTAGKVSNSATTATTSSAASSIVLRDANGYITNNYFSSSDDISTATITYIMAKFGDNRMRSATAAKVAAFLSGQSMNIAGNATTAGGLSVHSGTNNEANKIVRTNASGHLIAGYINSSYNQAQTSWPFNLWGTNGSDSYFRTYSVSAHRSIFESTSHVTTYRITAALSSGYLTLTSNHGSPVRVRYADSVGSASSPVDGSVNLNALSDSGTHSLNTYKRFLKAWAVIEGSGTPAIVNSSNISSLSDAGTSTYHRYYTCNVNENIGTNGIVVGVGFKSHQGYDTVYNGTSVNGTNFQAGVVSASAVQTGPLHTPAANAVFCLGVVGG